MKTVSRPTTHPLRHACQALLLAGGLPLLASVHAASPTDQAQPGARIENPQERAALAARINDAIERANAKHSPKDKNKKVKEVPQPLPSVTVKVPSKPGKPATDGRRTRPVTATAKAQLTQETLIADASASRRYIEARAAELAASAPPPPAPAPPPEADARPLHWSYQGDSGPPAWGQLHPAFATCDKGLRQSPIHITAQDTVAGPAEPVLPDEQAFGGTVAHTGHGIELEVEGENTLTLHGTSYRLARLQFHQPAEEKIHDKSFPMATDLVYQGPAGQLAVVSVPMRLGSTNPFIARIWPHMPLQAQDRVRLPAVPLQLRELLPQDRRSYQYLGSLTTPPCTEGVLRLVMKTPVNIGQAQLRLLARVAPANARPPQPVNGRVVREAQ